MTLLKKGVSRLSQLEIDLDKDWEGRRIFDLGHLAPGMTRGSLLAHDGTVLTALPPGTISLELTTHGTGNLPAWEAPPEG